MFLKSNLFFMRGSNQNRESFNTQESEFSERSDKVIDSHKLQILENFGEKGDMLANSGILSKFIEDKDSSLCTRVLEKLIEKDRVVTVDFLKKGEEVGGDKLVRREEEVDIHSLMEMDHILDEEDFDFIDIY